MHSQTDNTSERRIEKVSNELRNVGFDKIEKLKDPVKARMKNLWPLPRCDR